MERTFLLYNGEHSGTETMVLNQKYGGIVYPRTISSLEGEELENDKSYGYLGYEIKSNEPSTVR